MPSGHGWTYIRKKKLKAGEGGWWPEKKKTEVALTFLTTGSVNRTVLATGVPKRTIENWRKQPWWLEVQQSLMDEDNAELDQKYTKVIKKALEVVEDRLENGNFLLNKTGEINRVPVDLKDSTKTFKDIAEARAKLRAGKTVQTERSETVNDKLIKLASQFAEMALKQKPREVHVGEVYEGDFIDAVDEERKEGLQVRVPSVSGDSQSQEGSGTAQQSAVNDG